MNRNRYRLIFSTALGMMVPVAEVARSRGKSCQGKAAGGAALALAGVLLVNPVWAELPVASAGGAIPNFVTHGAAHYDGKTGVISQVGNKSILNWQSFNVSAGQTVQFRQVDSIDTQNLVQGASFTSLNRIWDINPSVIAGSLTQAAGQKANVILVNSNGIAFMGGSQVNLNSFTASTLNMQDSFLDNFLPGTSAAQFENALDGGEARGFIKVFEGAQITAGSFGRVMLIAPTVVNKGTVIAPDGQVIAAAASRVYLRSDSIEDANLRGLLVEVDRPAGLTDFDTPNADVKDGVLDGQAVSLTNATEDRLGHVTNLGELSTPRGNVTMVGYAVNQQGIARATTSVVANGSVYLLAKDTKTVNPLLVTTTNIGSSRAGRVQLGEKSLTEILPEVADSTGGLDGTTGAGLAKASQVKVLGQDVRMAGSAVIHAPSATVEIRAVDNPSNPQVLRNAGQAVSDTARIHVASGARIDVAGLENIQVSAARNGVEVELRGDELKDTPVNQQGPLRGEKVYVDINRALANADAGKSTLIARDSLESYQAKLERTVAERSTAGGHVNILSEGETILEGGAVFDLSGGSVKYTAANVKTTLLTAGGKLVDLADASAETRYDGIATRYVKDYGRWNRKEVIDLGQSLRYDPGYTEGKDAGSLDVVGMKTLVMQADVLGRTTTGELQREAGMPPAGARLTLGRLTEDGNTGARDYKLNQRVDVSSTGATLPAGFKFGDALSQELKDTLAINPALMGKDKVAQLEIFSNQAAEVREALRVPTGGSVAITAEGLAVKADIHADAGTIALNAGRNVMHANPPSLDITVADGVTLSARGGWVNDRPDAAGRSGEAIPVDGGSITIESPGDVVLGHNTLVDVGGGARIRPDGKIKNGNGGDVTLNANGALQLGGEVRGYAPGKGGTYALKAQKIQVGGAPDATALNLDAGFFERGGFASFNLTGLNGVDIADDTVLRPTVITRELLPGYTLQPTGGDIDAFSRLVKQDDRVRQAANLSFAAPATGQGKIRLGDNAKILADDKAEIRFSANTRVDLLGEVRAAGGNISASINRGASEPFDASAAVWLGSNSVLDASGAARTYTDNQGLTQGKVLNGGKVSLDGKGAYVVTEAGSLIKVSGVAPVRLDVPNESGGLGRNVGSDAGSVTMSSTEGALLDGTIEARAGSDASRGGVFSIELDDSRDRTLIVGAPTSERVLSLAQTVASQAGGMTPGNAVPDSFNGTTHLGTQALEAAGFERLAFAARDAIRLEDGLDLGAGSTASLREISLNSPRIETAGGNAALSAHSVRFANTLVGATTSAAPVAGTGTLTAHARLLELGGELTFTGMDKAFFGGEEAVRFVGRGATEIDLAGVLHGKLKTAADLVFQGAVVAPATAVQYTISAPGRTVNFTRNTDTPTMPLSAFGKLAVEAGNIVQDGNVWAPFGQLDFKASNKLEFKNGSLTSVAAVPGSLLPFGKVQNGRTWVYDINPAISDATDPDNGDIEQAALPEKSVRMAGASIDMQSGAKIDLAGGGDVQAYEFTVGPGGSRDILADKNTYAILPGFTDGFAPMDAQEGFDRTVGEAVYLSGVPGLADGVYTLLPAHYALLPDAYAVKLDTGIKNVLPGQAYSRQDGVRIAAGYVTDSRALTGQASAPKDANWQGIQVLTREQVRARSEFSLTRASDFFADSRNRLQDAGLLSVTTSGSGINALKLDAIYNLAAPDGRGARVDISALKLAVTSGAVAGLDPEAVVLDAGKLNALGADSLLLGGTRSSSGDTTTIAVGADSTVFANDSNYTLKAAEVMLAAKDTLTLKAGSAIDAQGAAGDAGHYETSGNGAFVRAASTTATFARSGSPDGSKGTLAGEAAVKDVNGTVITPASSIAAADSIALDATKLNAFKGMAKFEEEKTENGKVVRTPVAGNIAVGATRINFGAAPDTAEGVTYSETELEAFAGLNGLTLTSYSTFDLYGSVKVGDMVKVKVDDKEYDKPTLQNLTLQGAGLVGLSNADETAQLNVKNLTLTNNAAAKFVLPKDDEGNDVALGSGTLAVTADTLTLGQGDKKISGFDTVTITANELVGSGVGKLDVAAPETTLAVARISGERGADQILNAAGELVAAQHTTDRMLAPVTALGGKWALQGTLVDFNSKAELPSGSFKLTATSGDVTLGANARVDVAGREVQFFDVKKPSWGGTAEFVSETGNIEFSEGSNVNVSAVAGGDGGTLIVRAANGTFKAANGSVQGEAPEDAGGERGEGARVEIDVKTLASFSALNTALNGPGRVVDGVTVYDFDGARTLRVRNGDVTIADADTVKANAIRITVDGGTPDTANDGKLYVEGTLDASGDDAGRIELFAKSDVNVRGKDEAKGLAGAKLLAQSSGAGEDGGDIEIGSAEGTLNFASSTMKVQGGSGGAGGTVLLRALRTGPVDAETGVAVKAFDSTGTEITTNALGSVGINGALTGARSISVEAVKVYQDITMLTATDNSPGNLGLDKVTEDNAKFAGNVPSNPGANYVAIKTRLGKTDDPALHILSGVEIRSTGDLTLAQDWNLKDSRAGGEAGALTLRAAGNLNIDANLSDGFSHATAFKSGTTPADVLAGDSWSYRLIAGADSDAANPLAVKPGDKDFTLAAGKLIRTGTGDIRIASGRNINLTDNKAVIYTAGRLADPVTGFVTPAGPTTAAINFAQFSQGGGDVGLNALGDIVGSPSAQIFNNWLFRQGQLDVATQQYLFRKAPTTAFPEGELTAIQTQPAWWVRFDQFRQGVGALGGGDVTIQAGGKVENLSASAPTQARMGSTTPVSSGLVTTGGGTVRVDTGGDLLGGQYYADRGDVVLKAGGKVDSGQVDTNGQPVYAILALGDGEARVQAQGEVNINAVFNPHLFNQSRSTGSSTAKAVFNVPGKLERASAFSTYSEESGASLHSLYGAAQLHGSSAITSLYLKPLSDNQSPPVYGLDILPPSMSMVAFQGDVVFSDPGEGVALVMFPAPHGSLELLARDSISLNAPLIMSDRDAAGIPNALRPINLLASQNPLNGWSDKANPAFHAPEPVHAADTKPVRVYAVEGDIAGVSAATGSAATRLDVPKAVAVQAGRDVMNLSVEAQHADSGNSRSRVQAGRDIVFSSAAFRTEDDHINLGGPGSLDVIAGRNIDLGTSGGIVSRGNIVNPALPDLGVGIRLAAGVGANGVDYVGAVDRLIAKLETGAIDDATLWQARWLTGDATLTAGNALTAVRAVDALDANAQQESVRTMLFIALRVTGRDSNNADSAYAGDYARGYAVIELVFPGIEEKNPDGSFKYYQGDINLLASRVKTESGGNVEWLAPGGDMIVGLANTSKSLVDPEILAASNGGGVLGIVTSEVGDIQGFSRGDVLVNQSRILTVGGGDVLLWSSEGDIDAGKGKKTAVAVPPPLILVDSKGNVTQVLQGAASGSGIGALQPVGGTAGDVDLVAPKGTVNAGDAGIRAGNLNIAAQVVLGADNISVSGSSTGTPLADTSAVTAATSGASNAGGDVSSTTAALAQNLAEAARVAEELKQAFKPTFISAEVIGHGE